MSFCKHIIFILLLAFSGIVHCKSVPRFLSSGDAANELAIQDDFIKRLSKFDMSARMKTDKSVSEEFFINFLRNNTLDWANHDKAKVTTAFNHVMAGIESLNIILPETINLILTTGNEEGNTAYTRGNSIILQRDKLPNTKKLKNIIAHEIFHIYARSDHKTRDNLYKTIGFHLVDEITFPEFLKDRKITNPDAPINNYAISINYQGTNLWVIPICYSKHDNYIPGKAGEFFDYLQFKLLVVLDNNGNSIYKPGNPVILDVYQVTGFFEKIGVNTGYFFHPEEILANSFSNF